MNRRNLLISILVVIWGVFSINDVVAQTATPATSKTKKVTPTSTQTGAKKATPATPAKPQMKPTAKPAVNSAQKNVTDNDLNGYWLTAQKATIVQFYKAGDKYNGKVVWSKQKDKNGKALKDVNNPDRAKRNNPIVGSDIITGLTYNPKTKAYEGGKVYQPQTGKSFSCKVQLDKNKNTLQVIGGTGFISKTLTWTRTTGIPGKK